MHPNIKSVQSATSIQFDIRNFTDRLTHVKGEKWICPNCGGNDLSIDEKSGKYKCWHGCENVDIREAVAPWDEVKGKRSDNILPMGHTRLKKTKLPSLPTEINLATIDDQEVNFDPTPITTDTLTTYPYSDTQKVARIDSPFAKKHLRPYHLHEKSWIKGKGDQEWEAYRLNEALEHGKGNFILVAEGEKCVEAARYLGVAAITWQGGSWTKDAIRSSLAALKDGGVEGLVIYPDHDQAGAKKAEMISAIATDISFPVLILDPLKVWENCPEKGDIADWIEAHPHMDKLQFIEKLEKQIHAASEARSRDIETAATQPANALELLENSEVNITLSVGQTVYKHLYKDGNWIAINGILHEWIDTHYEARENEFTRIAHFCHNYYVLSDKKSEKAQYIFPYATTRKIKEAYEYICSITSVSRSEINPPGINFKNGVLVIRWDGKTPSWELTPHTPERYYIYNPLVRFDPEADPTDCDKLLSCLEADHRDIFLKVIASSFDLNQVRKYLGRSIRAILAKGSGNNGKDTLREVVSVALGHQGVTGVPLSGFENYDRGNRFDLSLLEFSVINWSSENATTSRLDKLQVAKQVITGDPITIEKKHQQAYEIKPKCINIFNINDDPYLSGTQEAIASRYVILPFSKTFLSNPKAPGEIKADPRFKDDPEFIQSNIAPALINKMLEALSRLMLEGIDYSPLNEAMRAVQRSDNHLWDFCDDAELGYGEDPNAFLGAGEIFNKLRAWYKSEEILATDSYGNQSWIQSDRAGDSWVKSNRLVVKRIKELFPKARETKQNKIKGLLGLSFGRDHATDGTLFAKNPTNGNPTPTEGKTEGKEGKWKANGKAESLDIEGKEGKEGKISTFSNKDKEDIESKEVREIKNKKQKLSANLPSFPSDDGTVGTPASHLPVNLPSLPDNLPSHEFVSPENAYKSDPAMTVDEATKFPHTKNNESLERDVSELQNTTKNILCKSTKPKNFDDLLLLVQAIRKWEGVTSQVLALALDNLVESGEIEKVDNGYQLGKF
jgi:putative DNA primase/helicase